MHSKKAAAAWAAAAFLWDMGTGKTTQACSVRPRRQEEINLW